MRREICYDIARKESDTMSDPTNVDAVLVVLLLMSVLGFAVDFLPSLYKCREGFLFRPWHERHMNGIVFACLVLFLSAVIAYRMVSGG